LHIPGADGKVLSLKVLDQRGFEHHISGGRIQIIKGAEVYTKASLGRELYEVKMMIVPSQETRPHEARAARSQPETRAHPTYKVLILTVTRDAPKIKIMKTNHEVKMEEISTGTCSHKEEFMKDTHQGTPKPSQPEDVTILATMAPTSDEALQQILKLKTCLD